MFRNLKSTLALLFIFVFAVIQISLVVMMTHEGHENFCNVDEHCILQSVVGATEAVPPLLTVILPIIFVFTLLTKLRQKEIRIFSSPPNFKFLQTLEGIVQRE